MQQVRVRISSEAVIEVVLSMRLARYRVIQLFRQANCNRCCIWLVSVSLGAARVDSFLMLPTQVSNIMSCSNRPRIASSLPKCLQKQSPWTRAFSLSALRLPVASQGPQRGLLRSIREHIS